MLRNGLARQLIGNIPEYLGGTGFLPAKGEHKKVVDIIPVNGHLVNYNDDVWDFSDGFRYQRRTDLKISFKRTDPEYKNCLKDFIAQLIDDGHTKVSTACGHAMELTNVFNRAVAASPGNMFILVDTDAVIAAVEESYKGRLQQAVALKHATDFIAFIRENRGLVLPVDLDIIGRRRVMLADIRYKRRVGHHHKNIPEEYFNEIIRVADRVMRDEKQPFDMRMTAGMILMDTQLGLRMLEVTALEKDCVKERPCKDGKVRYYVEYNSIKPARATVEAFKVITICTPLMYDTWKYMLGLRARGEYAGKTNFMFILNPSKSSSKGDRSRFPVSLCTFQYCWKVFFGRYLRHCTDMDWKDIRKVVIPNGKGRMGAIPTVHNMRVHFATSLYTQGFPLDFIESIMSHTPQSNTYDCYYDIDSVEFEKKMKKRYSDKSSVGTPEEEFEEFLEKIFND